MGLQRQRCFFTAESRCFLRGMDDGGCWLRESISVTEEVVLRVESSDGCCFVASDTTSVGVGVASAALLELEWVR